MTQPKIRSSTAGPLPDRWDTTTNLLEIDFRHNDPESVENLLDQLPDTPEVPVIEYFYDTRGSSVGMVRCRHCKKTAANHNRGFVLRYANGARVLFGKDCGEKQYGDVFVDQEKRFHAARKLQELLKRKLYIQQNRVAVLDLIERIDSFSGWEVYCETKGAFRSAFWFVFTEIGKAVQRHGGQLTRVERVRDHEAEARQESKKKRPKPIYRDVEIAMGTLAGRSFFAPGPLPTKMLPDLLQRLRSALWSLDDKDRARDLELTLRGIEDLVAAIEGLASTLDELSVAVSQPNIELLISWMTANGYGQSRYEEGRLYRHDTAGNVVAVRREGADFIEAVRAEAHLHVPPPFPKHLFSEVRSLLRADS